MTLLETLIVLMLITILSTLLIPSIRGVRESARQAQDLSNLRSHASMFAAYAVDHRDTFPYFTDPRATYTVLRAGDSALRVRYFGASVTWHVALLHYYQGNLSHPSFHSPLRPGIYGPRVATWRTPYHYGCSFIAGPEYWNDRSRGSAEQWRPTRHHEVVFPDSKVLLVNNDAYLYAFSQQSSGVLVQTRNWFTNVATVNGAAMMRRQTDPIGRQVGGDGNIPAAIHYDASPPFMHTLDGVRGRDLHR